MPKAGWLYDQFLKSEKEMERWPTWMKSNSHDTEKRGEKEKIGERKNTEQKDPPPKV